MILPETKFTIVKISGELKTKSEKKYREIILKKNAPKDDFGDLIGKDDLFKVMAWEKQFEQIGDINVNDRVLAQLYMNGQEFLDQQSRIYYQVNFSLKSMKIYTPETK